jgi:hypothetical protein
MEPLANTDPSIAFVRELLEVRIAALENRVEEKEKNAQAALLLAKSIAETQREKDNEVRKQLTAQANTFLGKEIFNSEHSGMAQRIDRLTDRVVILERVSMTDAAFQAHNNAQESRFVSIEKFQSNLQGRMWAIGASITIIFAIVQVGIALMRAR